MVRVTFCRWKVLSDCGRDCNDCTLFHTYCPGCITRVCLISKCKRGISHIGITDPKSFCRLREYCTSPDVIPADYMIRAMPKGGEGEHGRHSTRIDLDLADRVRDAVRKVIRYGPGDIKWVNLHLYKGDEENACEEVENRVGDLNDLMASFRKNDEKAKELATKLARERLKSKMDLKKEIVPEYELVIELLMQRNVDKAVVCLIGYNFQADKIVKNGQKDFKWLGKVVGYSVDDIKKACLIEIEEEEGAYFFELGVVG